MSQYKRPTVASLLSRWLRCWRAASQQLRVDPATLADAKLESTLTNENNKKLRYLIADLKSHVKLALPCELTRQNRHVHAGLNMLRTCQPNTSKRQFIFEKTPIWKHRCNGTNPTWQEARVRQERNRILTWLRHFAFRKLKRDLTAASGTYDNFLSFSLLPFYFILNMARKCTFYYDVFNLIPSKKLVVRPSALYWSTPEYTAAVRAKQASSKRFPRNPVQLNADLYRLSSSQSAAWIRHQEKARDTVCLRGLLQSGFLPSNTEWWSTVRKAVGEGC